jgi:hypothetical protein
LVEKEKCRKVEILKGENVEEIDFSSHRFLVNDLNNNLFFMIQREKINACEKLIKRQMRNLLS